MSKDKQAQRTQHIPERTCIGCQQSKPKRELVRVVRTVAGTVEVDATGKKAGRGAYLCQDLSCWDRGLKGAKLAHALHHEIGKEQISQLQEFAKSLVLGTNCAGNSSDLREGLDGR